MNISDFLTDARQQAEWACGHYEKLSPYVAAWADEMFVRLNENAGAVAVLELRTLDDLFAFYEWQQHNAAQNCVYKCRLEMGQDAGVVDF